VLCTMLCVCVVVCALRLFGEEKMLPLLKIPCGGARTVSTIIWVVSGFLWGREVFASTPHFCGYNYPCGDKSTSGKNLKLGHRRNNNDSLYHKELMHIAQYSFS
jgi:hypothetical protein